MTVGNMPSIKYVCQRRLSKVFKSIQYRMQSKCQVSENGGEQVVDKIT